MFGISTVRLVVYGILAAVIGLAVYLLWDSIYEKGKNFVYAQDNAARVAAQDKQIRDDAERVKSLNIFIDALQAQGSQIKEKIRVVQGPCVNDGADDIRLKQLNDWLQSRPSYDSRSSNDRLPPKDAMPKTRP